MWPLQATGLSASVHPSSPFKVRCRNCLENIGIMENQMETTIVYWGFIGIMEKKMEATIV